MRSCYGNDRKASLILIRCGVEVTQLVLAPCVATSECAGYLTGVTAATLFAWQAGLRKATERKGVRYIDCVGDDFVTSTWFSVLCVPLHLTTIRLFCD